MNQRVIVESDLAIFLDRLEMLATLTLEASAGAVSQEARTTLNRMTAEIQIMIGEVLKRIKAADTRVRQLRFMSAHEQDAKTNDITAGLAKSIDASAITAETAHFLECQAMALTRRMQASCLPLLMKDNGLKAYAGKIKRILRLLQREQRFRPWEFGRTAP